MGTDISGFVECRPWDSGDWLGAIDLLLLNVDRNYDAFGCLFGMRNFANFRPLAADRGLPSDASETVRTELGRLSAWPGQAFGVTWISWAELKAVDWDEPAELPDSRIHRYRQTPDGLKPAGKAAWDRAFAEAVAAEHADPAPGGKAQTWPEGTEWVVGDHVYRSERMRRRDAVPPDGDWQAVWTVMEALASQHGDDNVRLVVWFDN